MIALAYLLFGIILTADLYTDYVLIERKGLSPNHARGLLLRISAMVVPSLIAGHAEPLRSVLWGLHFGFLFWLMFDMALNHLRGRKPLYVGYTAMIDLTFRAVFTKPEYPMLTVKITLIIISLFWIK